MALNLDKIYNLSFDIETSNEDQLFFCTLSYKENEKANMDHTKASVMLRILVTLFVESVICVILGYGGYLVYCHRFNAGQLVEFMGYFTAIIWTTIIYTNNFNII